MEVLIPPKDEITTEKLLSSRQDLEGLLAHISVLIVDNIKHQTSEDATTRNISSSLSSTEQDSSTDNSDIIISIQESDSNFKTSEEQVNHSLEGIKRRNFAKVEVQKILEEIDNTRSSLATKANRFKYGSYCLSVCVVVFAAISLYFSSTSDCKNIPLIVLSSLILFSQGINTVFKPSLRSFYYLDRSDRCRALMAKANQSLFLMGTDYLKLLLFADFLRQELSKLVLNNERQFMMPANINVGEQFNFKIPDLEKTT